MDKITVDARGLSCPQPVIETKRVLDKHSSGVVEILVDNRHLARERHALRAERRLEDGMEGAGRRLRRHRDEVTRARFTHGNAARQSFSTHNGTAGSLRAPPFFLSSASIVYRDDKSSRILLKISGV